MKGLILIGAMILLFVAVMPVVSWEALAADFRIEQLVPAETQEVDTKGTPFMAAPTKLRRIPAETQEVDTSGTPWVAVKSPNEPWKIEQLVPAETQEVEESGATR